jgi:flagellar biosynthesis regulator FlbT
MNIPVEEKIKLIENKMANIAREVYNQELNLKMYAAYQERQEVIQACQSNIDKQTKAYEALRAELEIVKS